MSVSVRIGGKCVHGRKCVASHQGATMVTRLDPSYHKPLVLVLGSSSPSTTGSLLPRLDGSIFHNYGLRSLQGSRKGSFFTLGGWMGTLSWGQGPLWWTKRARGPGGEWKEGYRVGPSLRCSAVGADIYIWFGAIATACLGGPYIGGG